MPSQLQYKTFQTIMDLQEFVNNNWEKWEWWQLETIPDYKQVIQSRGYIYRLFYIVKAV